MLSSDYIIIFVPQPNQNIKMKSHYPQRLLRGSDIVLGTGLRFE